MKRLNKNLSIIYEGVNKWSSFKYSNKYVFVGNASTAKFLDCSFINCEMSGQLTYFYFSRPNSNQYIFS